MQEPMSPASARPDSIPTAAEDSVRLSSDQPPLPRNFPRQMTRADTEFPTDIIEVIIDVGLAAIDDHGNLPGGFAGLAPLQELSFPVCQSDGWRLFALQGLKVGLVWR